VLGLICFFCKVLLPVYGSHHHFKHPVKKWLATIPHPKRTLPKGTVASILKKYPDVGIIFPVHLNPNVQEPVNWILGNMPSVHLIEPLDYLPFIYLMLCPERITHMAMDMLW
jgi:UDP-N-acetylglucosamine 2-epimerase